jgi:hypothetical protein
VTARDVYTTTDTQICFTMLIEGYNGILTSWSDESDVVTAYSGTEWSGSAIHRGLQVPSDMEQSISLWSMKIATPSARFVLYPDDPDTFGSVAHRTANTSGFETFLSTELSNTATTVSVKDATAFASSGTIHIGTEEIAYTGKTASTFTGCTRGKHAPFKANTEASQRFGRRHQLTNLGEVVMLPRVTSYRRAWIGRTVRVLLHTVQGSGPASTSVLDTFANAETIFEGTIEAMDESESGATVFDCVHYNQRVSDTMLYANQFRGIAREGFFCHNGLTISIAEEGSALLAEIIFKTTGASPPGSITSDYYNVEQICGFINDEIAATAFASTMRVKLVTVGEEHRLEFTLSTPGLVRLYTSWSWGSDELAKFLGMNGDAIWLAPPLGAGASEKSYHSDFSPLRVMAFRKDFPRFELTATSGDLVTPPSVTYLPSLLRGGSSGTWILFDVHGILILAKRTSDTVYHVKFNEEIQRAFGGEVVSKSDAVTRGALSYDEVGDLEVRQIVAITGGLKAVMLRLLASTGTAGYNHATYDEFDEQLGCAIPWELLQDLEAQFDNIQTNYGSAQVTVVLDKPVKFEQILAPELALRGFYLISDNGRLRLVSPSTPGSTTTHSLATSSKAGASGADDNQRTSGGMTHEFIKTKITVEYNRGIDDKYRNTRTIVNLSARSDYGQDYPMTIKARNTFGQDVEALSPMIERLISHLGDIVLGQFAYPLKRLSRTINRRFFHVRPGDTVSLTDDSIRDPRTGVRGLSNYPCWVEKVQTDWSTGIGTVSLIMLVGDDATRYGVYSPAAKMVSYSAGPKEVTVEANEFTFTGTTASPDASHFAVGDKVRLIEESSAVPSSPDTATDTVAAVSGNIITLTTGFTPTGGVTYYVVSDDRTTAQLAQRSDAYIADDVDNKILDTGASNLWGMTSLLLIGGPAADSTKHFRFPANLSDDEGEPVSTFLHTTAEVNLNNLVNRRTAISCPDLAGHGSTWEQGHLSADSAVYRLVGVRPVCLHRGYYSAQRFLYLSPHFYRAAGTGSVRVRYTLAQFAPRDGTASNPRDDVVFAEPYIQTEFSTTSTTPVYGTRATIDTVGRIGGQRGVGFFCIELRAVSGETVRHVAVGEAWQGPLE